MITQNDFLEMVLNDHSFKKANEMLKTHNLEFTIYSANKDSIRAVLMAEKEIISLINEANTTERDIEVVFLERQQTKFKLTELERFFKAFDSRETKERLFVVIGETGVGKTYLVENRYPELPKYSCNKALDPYSLCYYLADKDGTGLKPYETPFLNALRNGGKLFMDEFNELPHDTLMFLQGITDEKRSVVIGDENVKISTEFKIIAAMNPPSETDERTPLGDAILGRSVGIVLELTDATICERLGVTPQFLVLIRKLLGYVKSCGMIDVRELNYRDYQKFTRYDFTTQFKFKVCAGDVRNIKDFHRITETWEYKNMMQEIIDELPKKDDDNG